MKYPISFWLQLAKLCHYDVRAAARHLKITLRQLERICQQDLHRCPREFFHAERMFFAADLVAKGNPIKTVALETGYLYLGNFSRDFKLQFGCTPREYLIRFRPPPLPPGPTSSPTP